MSYGMFVNKTHHKITYEGWTARCQCGAEWFTADLAGIAAHVAGHRPHPRTLTSPHTTLQEAPEWTR